MADDGKFEQKQPIPLRMMLIGAAVFTLVASLLYMFSGEEKKREKPVPGIRPSKRDYRFQDHLEGPYPFEYEPPVQPDKLADILSDRIEFGSYYLDEEQPRTGIDRTPDRDPDPLGDQRWHVKRRSYSNLLGALRDRLPEVLESEKSARGPIRTACRIACSVDAPAGAGFAEANLRLAPMKKLPQAITRLAASYWLAKEYDRLDALLQAGPDYRPTVGAGIGFPSEVKSILQSVGEAERLRADDGQGDDNARPKSVGLQLALIRGDVEMAEAALEKIESQKAKKTYAPLVKRLRNGLKASAGTEKHKKRLKKAFTEARRQLEDVRKPVHRRFANWPIERLEKHLAWTSDAIGGYTDPVADILAYMVEQRDYRRVKVSSGTALIAAKRFCARSSPARALPMFLLCQKVGYLGDEGQFDEDGPNAMVAFNAFEAPVYFAKTITGYPRLRKYIRDKDAVYTIAMEMYEYSLKHCRSEKAAGIAGRPGYEQIALFYRWNLALQTGRADDMLPEVRRMMRGGPTSSIRNMASDELGQYYQFVEDNYRRAADIYADMALGTYTREANEYGVSRLGSLAKRYDDPVIAERCRRVAEKMLDRYGETMDPAVKGRVEPLTHYSLETSDD